MATVGEHVTTGSEGGRREAERHLEGHEGGGACVQGEEERGDGRTAQPHRLEQLGGLKPDWKTATGVRGE